MTEAASAWHRLEEPWRACFELAWEACAAGSVGVGAVVSDEVIEQLWGRLRACQNGST